VQPGECFGVIGRNGAGKSTLLKILSRITAPTEGRVVLRGRVAGLLEVGTGFHPELTGVENIFLNGAILGMSRREIAARFDEIVAFSEVEAFLDTPVKHYSSGMYMRLAFAVAAHLEAEILLVDEVLAVGDVAFQRKCLGKMENLTRSGRTVLFVSHNMLAVQRLCQRAILIEKGRVTEESAAGAVVSAYLRQGSAPVYQRAEPLDAAVTCFTRAGVQRDPPGRPLTTGEPVTLDVEWATRRDVPRLRVGIGVNSPTGIRVFGSAPEDCGIATPAAPGSYRATIVLPPNLLLAGDYSVSLCLWADGEIFDYPDPAFGFRVEPAPALAYARDDGRAGLVQVLCEWQVRPAHADEAAP
jgi:lipopolysaccharide transport system ATP-binding protein